LLGFAVYLIRQRTLILWWDTGTHAAREEVEGVELAAARFEGRTARSLIASLRTTQDGGGALEMA